MRVFLAAILVIPSLTLRADPFKDLRKAVERNAPAPVRPAVKELHDKVDSIIAQAEEKKGQIAPAEMLLVRAILGSMNNPTGPTGTLGAESGDGGEKKEGDGQLTDEEIEEELRKLQRTEKQSRDMRDLSSGMTEQIRRNERIIEGLKAQPTVEEARQAELKDRVEGSKKIGEQMAEAVKQSADGLKGPTTPKEVADKMKFVADTVNAFNLLINADLHVSKAEERMERIADLEKVNANLIRSKVTVDGLGDAYESAARILRENLSKNTSPSSPAPAPVVPPK